MLAVSLKLRTPTRIDRLHIHALEAQDQYAQYWRYHPGGGERSANCKQTKENKTKRMDSLGRGADDTTTAAPTFAHSFIKVQWGSMIVQMFVISDKLNETLLKSCRHRRFFTGNTGVELCSLFFF